MKNAIVLYMPVFHKGYFDYFLSKSENEPIDTIFLISGELVKRVDEKMAITLERDLRALPVKIMQEMIMCLILCEKIHCNSVEILDSYNLQLHAFDNVFVPDDEVTEKVLLSIYHFGKPFIKENIFLRWNWNATQHQNPVLPDLAISWEKFDKDFILRAFDISKKSSDWWRNIGAIIVPIGDFEPIEVYNHHLPHPESPNTNGDPRSNFNAGESIEMSTAIHAEASGIAYAAKNGISLLGASMYTTTFPCPVCARLIAEAGIKKVYFSEGYSRLDALEILKSQDIEIIVIVRD